MRKLLVVIAGAAVLGCLAAPAALAQDSFTSGSVRGAHFPLGNWTARDGPNGFSGHMTLMFPEVKTELHANVVCVSIEPGPFGPNSQAASILGEVYKTDDPFASQGNPEMVEFEVVDVSRSGEGDEFRYNTTSDPFSGPPPDCLFGGNPTFPIQQGNVNIKQVSP